MSERSDEAIRQHVHRDLIFDLGMHLGFDTAFYLKKGFKVVAIEANPKLVAGVKVNYRDNIASGELKIVERALSSSPVGAELRFYINPVKDDWSSVVKSRAEQGGHQSSEIVVAATNLPALCQEFGVPYYIKCDIEGSDIVFVKQLVELSTRPPFVSVECGTRDLILGLRDAGYERFQFVNQLLNGNTKCPEPAREGKYVESRFNGHMSGLFAKELEIERWVDFDAAISLFDKFADLKRLYPVLAPGWIDIHATMREFL